jgi:hypothetical protein
MFTTGRKKATHRLGLNGPERLEAREVLSANLGGLAHLPPQASPTAQVDLAIQGTHVDFDAYGLPSYMAGDVALVSAGGAGQTIGRYQEALTPILLDVTGDGYPDFIGTMGVATFTFFVGQSQPLNLGSITTANVSYIQGFTAAGQLLVGSAGTIVGSSGALAGASGGFTSTSIVSMYPTFQMDTAVHFSANRAVSRVLTALDWVAAHLHESQNAVHGHDRDLPGGHQAAKHDPKADPGHAHHPRGPNVEHVLSRLASHANQKQWEKAVDKLAADLGRWQHAWDRI